MKNRQDPRHQKRVEKFKKLFSYSYSDNLTSNIEEIVDNLETIDQAIVKFAPEWPIDRLNRIDLAILRLSIWEILIDKKNPPKVIIDEAVEISKEYGSESTAKFVNGVLGTLLSKEEKSEKSEEK